MNDETMLKLEAKLEAANKRIANHKPLKRSAAIEKIRAFADEYGMTPVGRSKSPTSGHLKFPHP
jgi:hypothetical protein